MTSSSTQGGATPPEGKKEAFLARLKSRIDAFLAWLSCVWDVFQDIGQVLKCTRLSLLITLLVGIVLIIVGQGQDLIVIHAENPGWLIVFFYAAVVFWAVNAWYWARSILTHIRVPFDEKCANPYFGGRKIRVHWLVSHLPRAIGTGAFLLVAIAQFKAAGRDGVGSGEQTTLIWFGTLSLVFAVGFYVITWRRRHWWNAIREKMDWKAKWLELDEQVKYVDASGLSDLPASVRWLSAVLTVSLAILFIAVVIDPAALNFLGPDIIFLIVGSLWIVPGSLVLFRSKRGDLPVLTILLVIALAFSPFNDNHTLRVIGDGEAGERLDPKRALDIWLQSTGQGQQGRPTLVMVATAGGGSRAAYWTASVLGTIQDLHPNFDDQLFGISGVSGGSVGASIYRSLLTALPGSQATCAVDAPGGRKYRHCARMMLSQDFLGPTLAATLLPDLVQRFLPFDVLPDRAEGLELAWESAWSDALESNPHQDLLARDFFATWQDGTEEQSRSGLPALFLNGTSVATGKRIVTSNLDVSRSITDAYDLFVQWPMQIRMSTAANNSARFPYIGPAGTMHPDPKAPEPGHMDRIVDGGYFENFGAATAHDLLQSMTGPRCGETPESCRYDMVVIQISSDPGYSGVTEGGGRTQQPDDDPGCCAAELTSPINTLLNTRGARGNLAAQRLHDWTLDQPKGTADFFEFRLDVPDDETEPPLGWTLSEAATKSMDCQFLRPSNEPYLIDLGERLGFDPSDFLDTLKDLEGCG